MTVCNMSIEAGARAGMVAPDETTFAYLQGRPPRAPRRQAGTARSTGGRELHTDPGARVRPPDHRSTPHHSGPQVTWGTSPGMTAEITERVPDPADAPSEADRQSYQRALEYMGLQPGTPLEGLKVDRVFLGSCTNARIEDLREAAKWREGGASRTACGRWSSPARSR